MSRPIGGRREACWAPPDNESTRRVKLAARAASGRAGLAAGRSSGGDVVVTGKQWDAAAQIRKTGDPKATGYLCVMGDLNPQPAD